MPKKGEKNTMVRYAAFLRGINVGGHNSIPMPKLKSAFESLRFRNVRTILASGNVVFETGMSDTTVLEKRIERHLKKTFERDISVLVRSLEKLRRLSESEAFKGIAMTPQTRLYVTFLSERLKRDLKIPRGSDTKPFEIVRVSEREVFSVITLTPGSRTVDLMGILEKEFGAKITTRNWNTIVRILKEYFS